jgi:WXG100 family type VII secretion target
MASGPILVTFAALQEGAGNVNKTANSFDQQLNDIKSVVANIAQHWTGAAAEGYNQTMGQWNAAQNDLNSTLAKIGKALQAAEEAYQQTESANAKLWS